LISMLIIGVFLKVPAGGTHLGPMPTRLSG